MRDYLDTWTLARGGYHRRGPGYDGSARGPQTEAVQKRDVEVGSGRMKSES